MQQMQKLIDFNEIQTLQIDQIYRMFISLIKKVNKRPKNQNGFICPHTVICNLQEMKLESEQCLICPDQKQLNQKFQLSGILYFLLGGHRGGQGTIEEFYASRENYFSKPYGLLDENVFQKLLFLLNETEFQKKKQIYDQIKILNPDIQAEIYTYELKKYCVIIVDPGWGFLQSHTDIDEITLAQSFKKFMEEYINIINNLKLELDDFKICIHNLFLGLKTKAYYILKFNLFYDYVCNCNQKKFSLLFYQFLVNSNSQGLSGSQTQSLLSDVGKLNQQQNDKNDFVELLNLLQQFLINQQSLAMSSFLTKYISFFSQEIIKQLKEFTNQDLLWNGYKMLFLQEIIELMENQFIKNNITSQLSKQLFQLYQQQIQNIEEINKSLPKPRFLNITQLYSELIKQNGFDQDADNNETINCPLLIFRQEVYQFLKTFKTFQDYKSTCNQQMTQPIFDEINYNNIIQYEESLKISKIQ
ncbi:unnamed protein product [Paramecium octaurelia]|uniref:Uncharacterized protein n=1 Tax=Paramecium octaurelia TaxID=43137 RepID=A0A8S1TN03_PAROT|nr:unnamed protein product [Paramecium octaurelia]